MSDYDREWQWAVRLLAVFIGGTFGALFGYIEGVDDTRAAVCEAYDGVMAGDACVSSAMQLVHFEHSEVQ